MMTPEGYRFHDDEWLTVEMTDEPGPRETEQSQREKLPAKGARKPNADEQEQDWGSQDDASDEQDD